MKKKYFYAAVEEEFPESSEFVRIDFSADLSIFPNKTVLQGIPVKVAMFVRTKYTNMVSFFTGGPEGNSFVSLEDKVFSLEAPLNGMDFVHMVLRDMLVSKFGDKISEYISINGLITLGAYFCEDDLTMTMLFCVVVEDFEQGTFRQFIPISDALTGVVEVSSELDKHILEHELLEVKE